jgi:CubicO group peptidase (beta-lactamase class C family)
MNSITPEQAGFSPARLRRLDAVMQRYVDRGQLAGAIALIARHGQAVHLECFGMRDVEAGQPMRPDAIFRIASMAKPITAVAAMVLYEKGLYQLDDPIADYIPAFRDTPVYVGDMPSGFAVTDRKGEITIRHLLTHTSGICLGADRGSPLDALYYDAVEELKRTPGVTNQSAVQKLAELPLAFQPGSGWRYGLSFEVLAALIEIVSGEWFDVFLKGRIFEPLGMKDTGHIVPGEKVEWLTALYGATEGGGLELIEAPANSMHVLPPDFEYQPGTVWLSGGGVMVSTVSDYARFVQMLLNGGTLEGTRLLSPKTVELMTANHLPGALLPFDAGHRGYGHGLGVRVRMDVAQPGVLGSVGEFTGAGGHGTFFWADPKEDLMGLLMLQLDPNPYPLHKQFQVLTYQAMEQL